MRETGRITPLREMRQLQKGDGMKRFRVWLQKMHQRHGRAVSLLLALLLLSALTLLLAAVMALVGVMMWYSPYGTLLIALALLVYYLIRLKR